MTEELKEITELKEFIESKEFTELEDFAELKNPEKTKLSCEIADPSSSEATELRQRQEILWSLATLATGTLRRMRGLMLQHYHAGTILLLPCKDVHTFGMGQEIDIAFIDKSGQVVESHQAVKPLRRLRNASAVAVVERFATNEVPWFEVGDFVGLSRHPAARVAALHKKQELK